MREALDSNICIKYHSLFLLFPSILASSNYHDFHPVSDVRGVHPRAHIDIGGGEQVRYQTTRAVIPPHVSVKRAHRNNNVRPQVGYKQSTISESRLNPPPPQPPQLANGPAAGFR